MRHTIFGLLTVAALAAHAAAAAAQVLPVPGFGKGMPGVPAETVPDDLSADQVEPLVARMTDEAVRRVLVAELHRKAAARTASSAGGGGIGVALVQFRLRLERTTEAIRGLAAKLATGIAQLPSEMATSVDKLSGGRGAAGLGTLLVHLAGFLAVGLGVHWLLSHYTAEVRRRVAAAAADGIGPRLARAAYRGAVELLPVVVFAAVTIGAAAIVYDQRGPERTFVTTYLSGAFVVFVVDVLSRFLLAPYAPGLRVVPVSDDDSRFIHRWVLALTAVGTFAWLTAGLLILTGMRLEAHLMIVMITGAIMFSMIIVLILQARDRIYRLVLGPAAGEADRTEGSGIAARFVRAWHWIAIGYIVVVAILWALSMLSRGPSSIWPAIGSIVLVGLLPILDRGVAHMLRNVLDLPSERDVTAPGDVLADDDTEVVNEAELAKETSRRRTAYVLQQTARCLLGGATLVALLHVWGVDIFGMGGPNAQAAFWGAAFDIAVTLLLAYLFWQLVKSFIDPHMTTREILRSDAETTQPKTRAETLVPLLRKTLAVVLVVITVMIVLSSIGVDIGPLLAGAGVVGLAVGFGAQTLVRDVVAGIFFLIDDAFRIGEYIEFEELRGEVEAISLRSLKMRHHRGAIHTVPFGELRSITNYNRDWVVYKMEFRLPFDTDVKKVKKLIKRIGEEMMDDPEHGPNLLQPLKSQGIGRVEDEAMILRVKFMCKPREQFTLRRIAYEKIKEAFAANGIQLASRRVSVQTSSVEVPGAGAGAAMVSLPQQASAE